MVSTEAATNTVNTFVVDGAAGEILINGANATVTSVVVLSLTMNEYVIEQLVAGAVVMDELA